MIVPESALFDDHRMFIRSKYGLQMTLKLLCAKLVHTPYYITLDADVVANRPLRPELFVAPDGRGFFDPEPRPVHDDWWFNSAVLLGVQDDFDAHGRGFGVTPAVLSTYGSLWVLEGLRSRFLSFAWENTSTTFLEQWLSLYGALPYLLFTEYTVYRLALDHLGLFEVLHAVQNNASKLHCWDVWTFEQLPWNEAAAAESGCVFSVVQSTAVGGGGG